MASRYRCGFFGSGAGARGLAAGVEPLDVFLKALTIQRSKARRGVKLALEDLRGQLLLRAGGLRHAAVVVIQSVQVGRAALPGRRRAACSKHNGWHEPNGTIRERCPDSEIHPILLQLITGFLFGLRGPDGARHGRADNDLPFPPRPKCL